MKQSSIIRFADEKVRESFYNLVNGDPSERELFGILKQAIHNIEANAFCGVHIPKRLIPREYIKEYNVKNLWKYDLPRGWRLIYTVRGEETIIISLILEWMSHKDYEKRFNYA